MAHRVAAARRPGFIGARGLEGLVDDEVDVHGVLQAFVFTQLRTQDRFPLLPELLVS